MITFKIHGMTAEEPARLLLATPPPRRGALAGLSPCKPRAAKGRAPGFGVLSFLPSHPPNKERNLLGQTEEAENSKHCLQHR